jgi:nitroreductase
VDTYLAIASKRDERAYAPTPIPEDVRRRILDAGRLSGSSRNSQRWEFVVVAGDDRQPLAETLDAPGHVRSAALVVAIVGDARPFDVGRCTQNMMLAAWNEGVASCPNGVRDPDAAAAVCGGDVKAVISLGYPARPRDPSRRSAEEWSERANRTPLDELTRRI